MVSSDLWHTLANAVHLLGEDGERVLARAATEGKATLTGRECNPDGTEGKRDDIPRREFADFETGAMRFNLDSNSIEANASVINEVVACDVATRRPIEIGDLATFERHVGRSWEDVRVAAHEIDRLLKSLTSGNRTSPVAKREGIELLCAEIVADRARDRFKTKPQYRAVVLEKVDGLGARAFNEVVWRRAIGKTGATELSLPGARGSRKR